MDKTSFNDTTANAAYFELEARLLDLILKANEIKTCQLVVVDPIPFQNISDIVSLFVRQTEIDEAKLDLRSGVSKFRRLNYWNFNGKCRLFALLVESQPWVSNQNLGTLMQD